MDHVWQIGHIGPPEHEMLEAYTTLGYLAAVTEKVELLAWVTAAVYREPGLLAKEVTTLDVLSGGRAWLGIGAAWNEEESRRARPAVPARPPSGSSGSRRRCRSACRCGATATSRTTGRHYRLGRTLNSPQSVQRPHPPILIGGGGEKKTLRMVAQYADACNLFDTPELPHKLDVLREHCEDLGRDYDEIAKTVMYPVDPGPDGENVDAILAHLKDLATLGVEHVHSRGLDGSRTDWLEVIGERIIPEINRF